MYIITYSDRARSVDIPKLDSETKSIIVCAIERKLMVAPEVFGKPLRHSLRLLRTLRVGDWRVVFQLSGEIVYIVTIRHRKQGYDTIV